MKRENWLFLLLAALTAAPALAVFRGALERAHTTGDFQPEQFKQPFAGAF